MPQKIETVLQIALDHMQKAASVDHVPAMLAQGNGVMHYFVEALAELYLNEEQQKQVQALIRLHMDCSYDHKESRGAN